jgi:hypothetical protein
MAAMCRQLNLPDWHFHNGAAADAANGFRGSKPAADFLHQLIAISGRRSVGALIRITCNSIKPARNGYPPKKRREEPMPSHKFKIGDIVAINPTISRLVPGGYFEVIKQQQRA